MINLDTKTDSEIEAMANEQLENMRKLAKADLLLEASRCHANWAHLATYLRNRQIAETRLKLRSN